MALATSPPAYHTLATLASVLVHYHSMLSSALEPLSFQFILPKMLSALSSFIFLFQCYLVIEALPEHSK